MLALNEVELRQTRFYQAVSAEGHQEGKQELLSRELRRKFGVQPQLENSLQDLINLPLEKLEDNEVTQVTNPVK
jgi:predicted transposase YdaD